MSRDCIRGALVAVNYNVAQLLKESIGAERRYVVAGGLDRIDELNAAERPVRGQVRLVRTLEGILATGKVALDLRMRCRRCLELFEAEVTLSFEEEFRSDVDLLTGAVIPLPEDQDRDLVIGEQHQLDLHEALRQYAVMAAESEALCSADCCGLCSQCGQNLNLGQCDCDNETIDPRLSALAGLLDLEPEASSMGRKTDDATT